MKKLLFTLLLFCNYSFGQITKASIYTVTGCSNFGSSNPINTAFTVVDNTVNILYISATNTNGIDSIKSNISITWELISSQTDGSRLLAAYRCVSTAGGGAQTTSIYFTGSATKSYHISCVKYTGAQLGGNGLLAIKQTVSGNGTGADPSITMATLAGQRNFVIMWVQNDANPFGGTPESGWSEDLDGGCTQSPTAGWYMMTRANTSDNTPTVTCSSSTWRGVAIELRQSGRRETLIN
jgi:hypothetical protein